ncbi:MAG TPA: septum formation protein Maf [Clostridiales bacterium]|nr:septum formation protein Maf [Clostridiales bacterium]
MHSIILASASPRRKELLEIFNIPFQVREANIQEQIYTDETPEQIAMALAFEKAFAVSQSCNENAIVIAADTIVVKDQILGKPANWQESYRMLKMLQGDVHEVITGLAVIQAHTDNKVVSYEKTKVKLKKLSDMQIKKYIETGEGWDKAGSYAIQGKGSAIVEWIQGDYFNVVGLPISLLYDILCKYFQTSLI